MKQEELDKVCNTADEMLKAMQSRINKRYAKGFYTQLSDECIKDVLELFRKNVIEKCGISN